jgi:hypothetical protein
MKSELARLIRDLIRAEIMREKLCPGSLVGVSWRDVMPDKMEEAAKPLDELCSRIEEKLK